MHLKMSSAKWQTSYSGLNVLPHWDKKKIATILKTFANGISWMKMFVFCFKFHWHLFMRVIHVLTRWGREMHKLTWRRFYLYQGSIQSLIKVQRSVTNFGNNHLAGLSFLSTWVLWLHWLNKQKKNKDPYIFPFSFALFFLFKACTLHACTV